MAAEGFADAKAKALTMIDEYLALKEWQNSAVNAGVEFKNTPHLGGHAINVFYGSKLLDASVDRIVDFCWNSTSFEKIKEFDPDCLAWRFVDLAPEDRVVYQLNKLGWPIWDRSFVTNWFITRKDGATIIAYTGIVHPDFPEKPKDDVRGNVTLACLHLTPTADGKTQLQRLMHIDPSGSIPSSLVNRLGGRQIVEYINWLEAQLRK